MLFQKEQLTHAVMSVDTIWQLLQWTVLDAYSLTGVLQKTPIQGRNNDVLLKNCTSFFCNYKMPLHRVMHRHMTDEEHLCRRCRLT